MHVLHIQLLVKEHVVAMASNPQGVLYSLVVGQSMRQWQQFQQQQQQQQQQQLVKCINTRWCFAVALLRRKDKDSSNIIETWNKANSYQLGYYNFFKEHATAMIMKQSSALYDRYLNQTIANFFIPCCYYLCRVKNGQGHTLSSDLVEQFAPIASIFALSVDTQRVAE